MTEYSKDDLLIVGPKRSPRATLVLAHGAGAPMDSEFMNEIANGLADRKIRVVRFEFPYMQSFRETGKKKPPNSSKQLEQCWKEVIELLRTDRLFIGGKSMGGRIATMIADESNVDGVVCLGYPFHPTGKPDRLRIEHLENMKTPAAFIQGERDPFGNREEVKTYPLSRKIKLHWLADGDHSFKPRKQSGITLEENLAKAIDFVDEFVKKRT